MDINVQGPNDAVPSMLDTYYRPLTVLFWDIVDSCQLLATMPLESFRDLIRNVQDVATDAIHAHNGFVARYMGDGILAYFGYPRSLEDDVEQAVRAALSLMATLDSRQTTPPIQCRVAIASGPVLVDLEIGTMTAREFPAFGEAPNLAARLLAVAAPNSIIVADNVKSTLGGLFAFEPLRDLSLKSFPNVRQAWRVLHAVDPGSHFVARWRGNPPGPCVGRDTQLDVILQTIFERDADNERRAVILTGEAGIGKSHLLQAVADRLRARGALILHGGFARNSLQAPFMVLVDAIRRVLNIESESDDTVSDVTRLFRDLGIESDADARLFVSLMESSWIKSGFHPHEGAQTGARVHALLVNVLRRIGQGRTTVLMLEDLHWADHAVHDLLLKILHANEKDAPFILLSDRSDNLPKRCIPERILHLPLPPLSPSDVRIMIQDRCNSLVLPDDAIGKIVAASEGNPLFAEELLAMRREGGALTADWTSVPESVTRITLSRMDHLTAYARHMLGSAAILGVQFSLDLLAFATDLLPSHVASLLEEASGFVHPDGPNMGCYRFRHSLIHAAIYESILPSRRRMLHSRIALHLEAECAGQPQAITEILAYHFGQAGETEKAIDYLLASGDKRMTLYALKDADIFYSKALGLTAQTDARKTALVLARRMGVLELNCAFGEIIRMAEQHFAAITGIEPSAEACDILNHYSHALLHGHRFGPAVTFARRGLTMAEQLGLRTQAARAKLVLLKALNVNDDPSPLQEAESLGEDILAVAESEGDVYLACAVCSTLALHYMQDGQLRRAHTEAKRLIDLGREHKDARSEAFGHWLNGWIALQDFRYGDAMNHAGQSLAAAVTIADQLVGSGLKGVLLTLSGNPQEGLQMVRRAHAAASDRGDMNLVSALDMPLGFALILTGALRAGLSQLHAAIARRRRDGNTAMARYGHLVMGELHVRMATRQKSAINIAGNNISLLDRLALAPHVVFARQYARWHLRIAAGNRRWQATSAGHIRIWVAYATLALSRHSTRSAGALGLAQARDAASEAGLPGVAQAADAVLQSFKTPPDARPGQEIYR